MCTPSRDLRVYPYPRAYPYPTRTREVLLHNYISSEFQSRQPVSEVADAELGSPAAVFSLKQVDAVTVVVARHS